ncbi:MAG: hypothetical protein ABID38_05130 [Candidatus Diapherotrites archaeon]
MNQKGIFFTIMAFLLAFNVILLIGVATENNRDNQEVFTLISSFISVNNKSNNIYRDAILYDQTGPAAAIEQRILPFSMALDENRVNITANLPVESSKMNSYIDSLNAMKIFLEDSNYGNAYDGIEVSIDTIQDSRWGGTADSISFIAYPFCLEYRISGLNQIGYGPGNCTDIFDVSNIRRFDLNIMVTNSNEDLNYVSCTFGGVAGCPQNSFDPMDPLPFFELEIDDTDCGSCAFGAADLLVSTHFDPAESNDLSIWCSPGTDCPYSETISVSIGNGFSVARDGGIPVSTEMAVDFKSGIRGIEANDFNYTLTKPSAQITKRYR